MTKSVSALPTCWPPSYPRHRPLSAAEAGALDRAATAEYGLPSLALMEHASRGVAEIALAMAGPDGHILVCCGPGNNGGDGYGVSRFLHSWGRTPTVLQMSKDLPGSADAQVQVELVRRGMPIVNAWEVPERVVEALVKVPALIVDALFGVNLSRELGGPFPAWVEAMSTASALRLAVDVPTGLHSDTGAVMPVAVRANVTATMAAPKQGFCGAEEWTGKVIEVDIGLPRELHGAYLL